MNIIYYRPVLIYFIASLILSLCGLLYPTKSYGSEVITVKVKENQNIRDIAKEYLHDPDQWENILRANNLKSPHEVQPGMSLIIPAVALFKANKELEISKKLIQQATKDGAKIFAPAITASAIDLRDAALEKRKAGEYSTAIQLAKSSAKEAKKAIKISIANQDVPAEAVVQNLNGQVHSKKQYDNLWNDVSRFDILQEGERVRTLSQSYAEILFRDDSRLHLDENAQALIRKMRMNLLENTGEAKVSLIKGDVLALLSGGKKEEKFQLEIPGVKTKINSQHFWVGRDKQGTRFANYDGELEISAAGSKVILAENQGTIIKENQKPLLPQDLLPSPRLLKPESIDEQFNVNTPFTWERVKGAERYLLEFARNTSFEKVIKSEEIRNATGMFPKQLGSGTFYWRVRAVSSNRLPGRPSEVRLVRVMDDDSPPFIVVQSPNEGEVLSKNIVEIKGVVEDGASLTIQDQPAEITAGGNFQFRQILSEGNNIIIVKATDQAGNVTALKRSVSFFPSSKIDLVFDPSLYHVKPNHFIVGQRAFAMAGNTEPHSSVTVRPDNDSLPAKTTSDSDGRFLINLQITELRQKFSIKVVSRSGKLRQERFTVEIDDKPPLIHFDEEIPSATGQRRIPVVGKVEGAISLVLNERNFNIKDGQFSEEIELKPGSNSLRFVAQDPAGNVSKIEKEVVFDSDAPEFIKYELSLLKEKGERQARLQVWAKDATGFVKTAPFSVQIGQYNHNGHMILEGPQGSYVGIFPVPSDVKGKKKLNNLTLSDYLGNSKEYNFN
jgi:hypothetical protein